MQFAIISISFASCSKDEKVNNPNDTIPEIPGYTLVWNDEFDGQFINPNKWSWEINGDGGGNNELQYYTGSPTNSFISNGKFLQKYQPAEEPGLQYGCSPQIGATADGLKAVKLILWNMSVMIQM